MSSRLFGGPPGARRYGTLATVPEQVFDTPASAPAAPAQYATLYRGTRTTRCIVVDELPTAKFVMATLDLIADGDIIGRQQQVPLFPSLDDPALEARLIQCPASLYAIRE